ncbi:DNA polymerase sliding clamp 2 [Metallosphaera sp. J1]|uniref:DNA polymerase sliding clamp n=1 Tax=Metallosphaera TaxID=41980 RepID=UPI001EDCEB6E|nr:DNA polymerase sliding clamp [Metallosphaera javensis (ex Hofmann et al. 2022)]MCG3107818.1 DNA polymerase sliding clamp 2 [Metallosphaera javensis (ex Hofmann et al. 2022)]BCS92030.1 MAG: DNA polymerase III sliding clamp [Metallosphaera javensis (ex Sakai et al. 2022)]
MFRAIYGSARDFYYIISSMSKITDELTLNLTEEGIGTKYLTDDKVMMGVVEISKDALEEYSIEKPVSVKLNLGDLKKILSKMKGRSTVEIVETADGIRISMRDEKTGTRSNLSIKAEKGEPQALKEPSVAHSVTIGIGGDILTILVDESMQVGEEVEIKTEDDRVSFEVEEAGKRYSAILRNGKPLTKLEIEKPGSSRYSLPVLEKVSSALSFSKEIEIGFGAGIPMKLTAPLEKGASIRFWVAPRL